MENPDDKPVHPNILILAEKNSSKTPNGLAAITRGKNTAFIQHAFNRTLVRIFLNNTKPYDNQARTGKNKTSNIFYDLYYTRYAFFSQKFKSSPVVIYFLS